MALRLPSILPPTRRQRPVIAKRQSSQDLATRIVHAHGRYVWRTLRLLGVRPADLDDVTQEVLLIAVQRHETFVGRASLRAWIRGICVKKAAGFRRRAYVRREVTSDQVMPAANTQRPDDALTHQRQLLKLSQALDKLDESKRAAFVLYEIEGLSMKDVARALNCPLQTAYARHRSARERVVRDMRRYTESPPTRIQSSARAAAEVDKP